MFAACPLPGVTNIADAGSRWLSISRGRSSGLYQSRAVKSEEALFRPSVPRKTGRKPVAARRLYNAKYRLMTAAVQVLAEMPGYR